MSRRSTSSVPGRDAQAARPRTLRLLAAALACAAVGLHRGAAVPGRRGRQHGPAGFAVSVRKGRRATLYFRITDNASERATVAIRIRTRGGALKQTLTLGLKGTGPERRARFTCRLPRGVYWYSVEARDLSGNAAQKPLGRNRLTVR